MKKLLAVCSVLGLCVVQDAGAVCPSQDNCTYIASNGDCANSLPINSFSCQLQNDPNDAHRTDHPNPTNDPAKNCCVYACIDYAEWDDTAGCKCVDNAVGYPSASPNSCVCDKGFEPGTTPETCTACAAGTYKANGSNHVGIGNYPCVGCPAGYSCAGGASDKVPCAAGTYAVQNSSICTACPKGSIPNATSPASSTCTPCMGGETTSAAGVASCSGCKTVESMDITGVASWETPTLLGGLPNATVTDLCKIKTCAEGYYLNNNKCYQCPIGSIPNAAKDGCEVCKGGETTDTSNPNQCTSCPDSTGVASWKTPTLSGGLPNATVIDLCKIKTCAEGYYANKDPNDLSKILSCEPCPAGGTSDGGQNGKEYCYMRGWKDGTRDIYGDPCGPTPKGSGLKCPAGSQTKNQGKNDCKDSGDCTIFCDPYGCFYLPQSEYFGTQKPTP